MGVHDLSYRPKYGADDAIPSGNGTAILGLLKLGNLLGESRYLRSAENALSLFANDLRNHPSVNALMTLTFDNGREFSWHSELAKQLGCETYFAKPYHSWERGLNAK